MSRGNWITVAIFVVGVIGSALTLSYQAGQLATAIRQNTNAISRVEKELSETGQSWALQWEKVRDDFADHDRRITRLEASR